MNILAEIVRYHFEKFNLEHIIGNKMLMYDRGGIEIWNLQVAAH